MIGARRRHMARVIVSGVLLASPLVGSTGAVADDDPLSYRVNALTFNLCGGNNKRNTCAEDLIPERRRVWAPQVSALIRSRDVDVASFTEMCYAQVDLLQRELPDYDFVWYGLGRSANCRQIWGDMTDRTTAPNGRTAGIALAFKNGVVGSPMRRRLVIDNPDADPTASVHRRGVLCARSVIGMEYAVGCVTHISALESPTQVTGRIGEWAGNAPVILGGDFNRLPEHPELTKVYGPALGTGGFTEADAGPAGRQSRGGSPTTRGGRKIDYIFASQEDYRNAGAEVIDTNPELSDHRPLAGTFTGTLDGGYTQAFVHTFTEVVTEAFTAIPR
ncbi:endonuclease/exonuclease/phosphatase family protein [Microtetraspora niveoalba]|uniref:endonuclease/exonuclease/phosphatase family protein n=1 Tax=Microtetraspora niveoalba TaxID=46175 RepID=UPI0009FBB442|nr:endonuclease/exonuclease/phosphatase family protein [Microtetraspora niveoalba]